MTTKKSERVHPIRSAAMATEERRQLVRGDGPQLAAAAAGPPRSDPKGRRRPPPAAKPEKIYKKGANGLALCWEGCEGSGPWLYLGGVFKMFLWWHFKPTKMIAGDVHLRCHQDRKFGNFLLQLLVLSDFDGSGRKTWVKVKHLENPAKIKPGAASSSTFPVGGRMLEGHQRASLAHSLIRMSGRMYHLPL